MQVSDFERAFLKLVMPLVFLHDKSVGSGLDKRKGKALFNSLKKGVAGPYGTC
jgi:hypothetical protein